MDMSVDDEVDDEEQEDEEDEVMSDDENETAPAPSSRRYGNKATKVIEESDEGLSRSEEEDIEDSEVAEEEDEDLDAEEDIDVQDDDDNGDERSDKGVELKASLLLFYPIQRAKLYASDVWNIFQVFCYPLPFSKKAAQD